MDNTNAPKKRGRKPKETVAKKNEVEKPLPKKRGRRPKDKSYSSVISFKDLNNQELDEEVIMHLPIKDDIETTEGEVYMDNDIIPYEPNNKLQSNYALLSNEIQGELQDLNEIDEVEAEEEDNFDTKVRKSSYEEVSNDYFKLIKKVKIHKMMSDYKGNKYPDNTSICCFNCTYQFDTQPIGLPVKYFRDKFYCIDNFCSFNCAARYLFNGDSNINKIKRWESYSLLNLMYSRMFDEKEIKKVKLAYPRTMLKKFGGVYSIEEYRESFINIDRNMNICYPPCSTIIPEVEESFTIKMHRKKAQMINSESRNSYLGSGVGDLRLKRDKVNEGKNTLENYMSLKIQ